MSVTVRFIRCFADTGLGRGGQLNIISVLPIRMLLPFPPIRGPSFHLKCLLEGSDLSLLCLDPGEGVPFTEWHADLNKIASND